MASPIEKIILTLGGLTGGMITYAAASEAVSLSAQKASDVNGVKKVDVLGMVFQIIAVLLIVTLTFVASFLPVPSFAVALSTALAFAVYGGVSASQIWRKNSTNSGFDKGFNITTMVVATGAIVACIVAKQAGTLT